MLLGLMWVGWISFFLTSLVVGIRLLWLARRTRKLPELLIGLGVLGIGPVGWGLTRAAQRTLEAHDEAARAMMFAGLVASAGGAFSKYLFNWRVYHPDNVWVRGVVVVAGGLLLLLLGHAAWDGLPGLRRPPALVNLRSCVLLGCLGWGSVEALRYWLLMRRRLALGLADPIPTNRFLLWSVGAGAAGMGTLVGLVNRVVFGASVLESDPLITLVVALLALSSAVAMGLAFVPPRAYLRWVEARGSR
ncbi:MAG: hypothetical protein MJE66_14275 [Proteobacteria bacterium]|nr:hypothetical protein [Pseudomonadota bacterium]